MAKSIPKWIVKGVSCHKQIYKTSVLKWIKML